MSTFSDFNRICREPKLDSFLENRTSFINHTGDAFDNFSGRNIKKIETSQMNTSCERNKYYTGVCGSATSIAPFTIDNPRNIRNIKTAAISAIIDGEQA